MENDPLPSSFPISPGKRDHLNWLVALYSYNLQVSIHCVTVWIYLADRNYKSRI